MGLWTKRVSAPSFIKASQLTISFAPTRNPCILAYCLPHTYSKKIPTLCWGSVPYQRSEWARKLDGNGIILVINCVGQGHVANEVETEQMLVIARLYVMKAYPPVIAFRSPFQRRLDSMIVQDPRNSYQISVPVTGAIPVLCNTGEVFQWCGTKNQIKWPRDLP